MAIESHFDLRRSIMAVLVLYKCAPAESESLNSLLQIFAEQPSLAQNFSLLLYDNSPEPHSLAKLTFPVSYKHEPSNGGLVSAYNYALEQAEHNQQQWLLLLDQDTSLTREFFTELLECVGSLESSPEVASIVPKLVGKTKIYSPEADFVIQMRRQYRRRGHSVSPNAFGVQTSRLGAYNSGATMRVSALRSIGGFPEEFWLDYLDHAVFHALSVNGCRMYVMHTMLHHNASQANMNTVPLWRQRNILAAQTLFIMRAGNRVDHLLYRIWLLRFSRKLRTMYDDKRLWKETALQAILWKSPTDQRYIHSSTSLPKE